MKRTTLYSMTLKCVVLSTFGLIALQSNVQAQEFKYSKPSWWFGAAAGANFNFYRGSTQQLDANFRAPVASTMVKEPDFM